MPEFYITLKAIIQPNLSEGIVGQVVEGNHVMRTVRRDPEIEDIREAKLDYYNSHLKLKGIRMNPDDLMLTMCIPLSTG